MNQQKLVVEIFGQQLTLKSEADPEYATRLASYVDEQIRKVSRQSNDPIKVVLLASMNIANELIEEQDSKAARALALARKADSLIAMVQKAI